MNKNILIFIFILVNYCCLSQSFEVSGKVLDGNTNQLLSGVNIITKNSSKKTTTDFDGSFKISKIDANDVLTISFVGYKSKQITVTQSEKIVIKLFEDNKSLEEIVVIGYGSKKKKDITGAVGVVSARTIEDLRPIKIEQALQGTIAGVNVTSQSGSPGAGFNISIRGIGTNGDSSPLIIVDGYNGTLDGLSPNDIESISILKDAQAAIYGSIGANGVVLVTTKSGKRNSKTKVTFNSSTGFQETTKKLNLLNATEYALLLNESYANGGQALPYTNISNLGKGTDWQKEVFKNPLLLSNDFSVSGGSDKINYSFSGSDLKQDGIIGEGKSGFKRNTARFALGADLSDKIKISTNVIYTYLTRKKLNDSGLGSVLFNAINTPATLTVKDQNGNYTLVPSTTGFGAEVINPLAQADNTFNDYNQKKISGVFKIEYDLFKNFKLTSLVGFNSSNSNFKEFFKEINYGNKVFNITRSTVNQYKKNDNDYSFDLYAAYEKTFLTNHKAKLTIGTTIYNNFGSGLFGTGYDVPNNSYEFADLSLTTGTGGLGVKDANSYEYDERRISQFTRFEYDYKGKYLFSAMGRRDLSTKFGSNFRVALFPSFTCGWIVSKENFFKENNTINFLKIRGSFGLLGSDKIPDNLYLGRLGGQGAYVFNGNLTTGTAIGILPNPNVKWEAEQKLDIGFDIQLFKSKIDITADYFENIRTDFLIPSISISGINGAAAPGSGPPTINAGSVKNSGFEFAINYKDKFSESFNFKLAYNVASIKNLVTQVNNSTRYLESENFGITSPLIARMQEGYTVGYFLGYKTDGIFQNQAEINAHPSQANLGSNVTSPGDIRYKDTNSDGVIDSNDRVDLGNPIPKFTMGFNTTLEYKNFEFNIYSYASLGNKAVRGYERVLSDVNKLNYVLDRWTGEGTSNTVPRVTTGASNNNVFSDYFVEDASFLRIQNIQLGYTLNQKVTEKIGINKFRFYFSIINFYTFTKYRGFDPAISNGKPIGGGIDNGFYPTPKIYTLGFNINF